MDRAHQILIRTLETKFNGLLYIQAPSFINYTLTTVTESTLGERLGYFIYGTVVIRWLYTQNGKRKELFVSSVCTDKGMSFQLHHAQPGISFEGHALY